MLFKCLKLGHTIKSSRLILACLVLLGACSVFAEPLLPSAAVFLTHSTVGPLTTSCSATLLRFTRELVGRETCRLITNAHCVNDPSKIQILAKGVYSAQPLITTVPFLQRSFALDSRAFDLKILKIDPSVDLAEVAMSSGFKKKFCDKSLTTEVSERHSANYTHPLRAINSSVSMGYKAGLPKVSFTRNIHWPLQGLSRLVGSEKTSLSGLSVVYQIPHLQMTNGMSGGVTVNQRGDVVGVNRRFVPYQELTEVIPLNDVIDFLNRPADQKLSDLKSGTNTLVNGGENSGANGGENSGANGGENSGANGSESPKSFQQDPLSLLREPYEGVWLHQPEGKKRLLAVGPYQIDGFDDLRRHPVNSGKPLFFNSDEFEVKKSQILERLKGEFSDYEFDGIESAEKFLFTGNQAEPFITLFSGFPMVDLAVTKLTVKTYQITLRIAPYEASQEYPKNMISDLPTPATINNFVATISDDASVVEVVTDLGNRLRCENKQFLKLICSSIDPKRPEEFSLSLNSQEKVGLISFRHAREFNFKFENENKLITVFRYGTLKRDR